MKAALFEVTERLDSPGGSSPCGGWGRGGGQKGGRQGPKESSGSKAEWSQVSFVP